MLPMLVWALDHYAGFRWFSEYDKDLETISFIVLLMAVVFVGPTLTEMEERRAKRIRDQGLDQ
ncbi:MAG TPA: hypothetical protein VN175_14585 [Rhizomicrobium sp.]|jgi:hypothetical protein|nr:hypothetical protein [Rhizomicrobium sp.]